MTHPSDLHEANAVRLREPAVAFDFDLLDSPVDLAHEELERALGRRLPRADVEALWHWHLRQTAADRAAERTVAERILLWIAAGRSLDYVASGKGGRHGEESMEARAERRIGLRAAVAINEVAPHADLWLSVRALARIFGVAPNLVHELAKNFRSNVNQLAPSPAAAAPASPPASNSDTEN